MNFQAADPNEALHSVLSSSSFSAVSVLKYLMEECGCEFSVKDIDKRRIAMRRDVMEYVMTKGVVFHS